MREIPMLRKKSGTALVLSGGATKAFYFHLGVLKALQDEKITSVVGSSAGAMVGAFLASGASVDAMISTLYQREVYFSKFETFVHKLTSDQLFRPKVPEIARQAFFTWLGAVRFALSLPRIFNRDILADLLETFFNSQTHIDGFFNADAIEALFKSTLRSTDFAQTQIDLYVTGTSLDDNKRAVFNGLYDFADADNEFMTDVPIHKAVRASTAIPGMFEPVKIKGKYYVDGEIKQTLSADVGVRLADRIIISHTYQPLHLTSHAPYASVRDMGWLSIYENQHPNKQIIWIQPDPEDVAFFKVPDFTFKPETQQMLIDSGEIAALKALNEYAIRSNA
jgi:NTE family protein